MRQVERSDAQAESVAAKPLRCPLPRWARRLGVAAFLLFLIKGLAWLIVPALLVWWGR